MLDPILAIFENSISTVFFINHIGNLINETSINTLKHKKFKVLLLMVTKIMNNITLAR